MLDPVTTPLLILVLGNLAHEVIAAACKDHLKGKLKSFFGWLEKLGQKDKVELAYQDAMEQAFGSCLEMLLLNIKGFGYSNEELKEYESSLKAFIEDEAVAEELLNALREPNRAELPSPDVLRERWNELAEQQLPSDTLWTAVAVAFRRQATKWLILSDDLRELLNAQNLQQLKKLIERQGGVKVPVRRDKYSQRMQTKFSPVDLANLMPAYAEDPGRMIVRDVFVPQNVRENPPPVEIPKDLAPTAARSQEEFRSAIRPQQDESLDEEQIEKLRTAYVSHSPRPVLNVIAAPGNQLLVLTGDPGSGKSTLMRYLLTGIIEPPVDGKSGKPLPWTAAFKDAFPLLIELRDFYALRRSSKCDSFLEYVHYMGKTDKWFLDDHAVDGYLDTGPSLVMFDGLDEIFETTDRQRVMQEIAGFAQRYPRVRIIVTSRPIGYKEQVLRDAGFAHFGIQDLDDEQIDSFIRGWFAITFTQQPQQAKHRIERVLGSVRQSKPIRLLAGNPMLLTIMALLAREQELPHERAKFYEKAIEVFCHHWNANKGLDLPSLTWLNVDDKLDLLRRVAVRMQTGPGGLAGNVIYENDLEDEIKQWFMERFSLPEHESIRVARTMIIQLRERNYILCLRGPHLYGFVHRTFLEYLTATEYVRRFDKQPQQMTIDELINLFALHCHDDEWREVLRLICGQIDEQFVGRIVDHLVTQTDLDAWDDSTPFPELQLAIWSLSECRILTKLEDVGRRLMQTTIRVLKQVDENADANGYWFNDIIPASRELGERWPGKEAVYTSSTLHSLLVWPGDEPWVTLLAAVDSNRERFELLTASHHPFVRASALWYLADKWPDEMVWKLLAERAVRDESQTVRRAALQALAENWADEATRTLLAERAVQDENQEPRRAGLEALADKWPDETTRKLITKRAVKEEDEENRRAALKALSKTWPDETTSKLLTKQAPIDNTAAHVLSSQHSYFGHIVFTKNLDGFSPFLDPSNAILQKQIKRAAKVANVSSEQIDETVRSLSKHLGWDITKGSGQLVESKDPHP